MYIYLVGSSVFHKDKLTAPFLFSFTDEAYKRISFLTHLEFLDLCGGQVNQAKVKLKFHSKIFFLNDAY